MTGTTDSAFFSGPLSGIGFGVSDFGTAGRTIPQLLLHTDKFNHYPLRTKLMKVFRSVRDGARQVILGLLEIISVGSNRRHAQAQLDVLLRVPQLIASDGARSGSCFGGIETIDRFTYRISAQISGK